MHVAPREGGVVLVFPHLVCPARTLSLSRNSYGRTYRFLSKRPERVFLMTPFCIQLHDTLRATKQQLQALQREHADLQRDYEAMRTAASSTLLASTRTTTTTTEPLSLSSLRGPATKVGGRSFPSPLTES